MPLLHLRLTGSTDDLRLMTNLLQSMDGIEHVEDIADLMPQLNDADSSSAGLSDLAGASNHLIEIEVPNLATAHKVRQAAEALAFDLDALVEFELPDE